MTGDYTCPSSTAMVYIVATGGNPGNGNGAVNPNLAMMATLGQCGNLTPSSFVNISELTTVAAVYALQPFMTTYTSVGTSATNPQGAGECGREFSQAGELRRRARSQARRLRWCCRSRS